LFLLENCFASFIKREKANTKTSKSQTNQFKTTKKDHTLSPQLLESHHINPTLSVLAPHLAAFKKKMNQGYGGGGGQNPQDKKRIREAEMRKLYANSWAVELMKAPCARPGFCLYASLCSPCVAWQQRKKQMYGSLQGYTCCNGGSCISGRCGEQNNPELCLACEVFWCFPSSVATTRFLIQDEQRVMNTQCDNGIIGFMLLMNQLACIFRVAAMVSNDDSIEQAADILDCISDMTYCSVCACMQTQQEAQIDFRNESMTPQQQVFQAPQVQRMAAYETQPGMYGAAPPQQPQQQQQPQPQYPKV